MTMKKILVALGVILFAGFAYAGVYTQYPQIGNIQNTQNPPGPAYSTTCTSAGNNGVCNQYQPFGPTSLQGTETIPADTNYVNSQGAQVQPVTVTIPVIMLGAGNTNYSTPLTGATVTAACTDSNVLLEPAGTLATLTIQMAPASCLKDGQTLRLASTQTLTALTVTAGAGSTLANGASPTALTVSTTAPYNYEFIYKVATAKWYRLQ